MKKNLEEIVMRTKHKGQPKDCNKKPGSTDCLRTRNGFKKKGKKESICKRCRAVQD